MVWVTPPTQVVPYGHVNPFSRAVWEGNVGKIFLVNHIGEAVYSPHCNEASMFVYICAGGYKKSMRGSDYEYKAGTMHYTPAEAQIRRIAVSRPSISVILDLRPDWQEEEAQRMRDFPCAGEPIGGVIPFRHFSNAVGNLIQSAHDPDMVDSIIFDTFAILPTGRERKTKEIEWLKQAYDLIRSDPASSHKVYRIAREVGIDRIHLGRTFRKVYGISVGEFIREQRLNKAWQMLLSEEAPLGEIASKTGFVDQAQFSRAFRERFGSPPSRFRRHLLDASWPTSPKLPLAPRIGRLP